MALKQGEAAPSFELFNSEKQKVSLESFKGKTLIIHFFPAAFTGVCTTQLCTMRDDLSYYTNLNAAVVGISVDSLFTLARFKEDQNYNFDLLSDFNKTAAQAYDAYYENFVFDMHGVARRAAFVVDKGGIVQYAEVLESAGDLPNFAAIKSVVAELN